MSKVSEKLKEMKARCEAATEGPWSIDPRNLYFWDKEHNFDKLLPLSNENCLHEDGQNGDFLGADIKGPIEPGRSTFVVRDAWFIANARTDMPALIEALEVLNGAVNYYADDKNMDGEGVHGNLKRFPSSPDGPGEIEFIQDCGDVARQALAKVEEILK